MYTCCCCSLVLTSCTVWKLTFHSTIMITILFLSPHKYCTLSVCLATWLLVFNTRQNSCECHPVYSTAACIPNCLFPCSVCALSFEILFLSWNLSSLWFVFFLDPILHAYYCTVLSYFVQYCSSRLILLLVKYNSIQWVREHHIITHRWVCMKVISGE